MSVFSPHWQLLWHLGIYLLQHIFTAFSRPPHGHISLTVQTETAVNRDRVGRKWGVCLLWHATAAGMCALLLPSASEGVFIYGARGYEVGVGIDLLTSRRICRKSPDGLLSFSLTVWHLRGKGERRVCRHQQPGLISLPRWHQIPRACDAPPAARGGTIYSPHSAPGFKIIIKYVAGEMLQEGRRIESETRRETF